MPETTSDPPHRPAEILIVEDEPADLALWRYAFRDSGVVANACFASDGQEALETIRTAHSSFDLVLLDLNLPKIGGKQVLQTLRGDSRFDAVPIFIFSTACTDADVAECYQMGANQCFIKPNSYSELVAMVRQLTATLAAS